MARRRRTLEALEPRQLLASLGGDVWSDLNSDGIRDATEPGAANVRVYLDANDNGQFDEDFEISTTTNVLGQYAFDQLSVATYSVRLELGEQQIQTSPRVYYGMGYTAGTGQTQLFSMGESGAVQPIGSPTQERIYGLIRTNDGVFYGINFENDSIYTIDGETGQETLLSRPGTQFVAGLAYDPSTDKIYTVGREGTITNVRRLYEVSREDGSVTPIGSGLTGLERVSDLTFDTANDRIVGFDNQDDEFFQFDLDGNGTSLSNAQIPIESWSLAHNGQTFVMLDQADPEHRDVLAVNPDTGEVQPAGFQTSTSIPAEALFFATSGEVAQRITVIDQDVFGVDFGVVGESQVPGNTGPALGGLFLNELMIDPQFGNEQTDQYIEIRGDSGAAIPPNTYLIVVEGDNFRAGEITDYFDLSNQVLGKNGFLVLLQEDSPYPVDADATILQSTGPGFSGMPGDIFQSSSSFNSIDSSSNSYFLVELTTDDQDPDPPAPPVLGSSIDADGDGLADPDGVIANWNILDSVSLHRSIGAPDQAFGQVVLVQEGGGVPNPLITPEGAEIVISQGYGYAARVGDSIGSTSADWFQSTVRDEILLSSALRYGVDAGFTGAPSQLAFQGRDLDHVGDSNFVGGVRGHVILEPDSPDAEPNPAQGVTVFADVNGNGLRDNLLHVVDPDEFPASTELINAFPGVTITITDDTNDTIRGFDVTSEQQSNNFSLLLNRHFAQGSIDYFDEDRRLRFDFYRPANTVSIVGIADDTAFSPTFIRLSAYDDNDNMLGTVLSNQLISSSSQLLSLSFPNDVIAYAVAYSDESAGSTNRGRLDEFSYRQFENSDITDEEGFYELTHLFPEDYRITFVNSPLNPPLQGAEPVPIVVARYENYVLGPNDLPMAEDLAVDLEENSPEDTIVGVIEGSDAGGQVEYSIEGDSKGIEIDPISGLLTVGEDAVLDFEATPIIEFQVGVSDLLQATTLVDVTISLIDVNETPVVTEAELFISEDTEPGTSIGQIQAFDPDFAQDQTLTFEVVAGNTEGILSVDRDNGIVELISAGSIDFERQQELLMVVEVTDNGMPEPLSATVFQTIQVVDSNDPPVLLTNDIMVNENATGVVGQIEVTDPDSLQSHQFILTGGSGTEFFNVESDGTVVVKPGAEIDFEAIVDDPNYTLNVTVVDDGAPPLSDSGEITVMVKDINEPAVLQPTSATVAEDAGPDTLVATITAIDPEGDNDSQSISLVSGVENFEFNGDTGQLRVTEGADLDFESKPVHELVFEIDDTSSGSDSVRTVFTVEVTDANDAPDILTQQLNVSELAPPESVVGEIRAVDFDQNDTITFNVTGGSAQDKFAVDADTGVVTVKPDAVLDAEEGTELTLEVRATDTGGLFDDQIVRVVLNDVNEPPVFVDDLVLPDAVSGVPYRHEIPADAAVDPEGGEFNYSVFNTEGGGLPSWLDFNPVTRILSGMPNQTLVGQYDLTVRAYEPGILSLGSEVQVQLDLIAGDTPLTNQRDPNDANDNGRVTAADANTVITHLQIYGSALVGALFVDTNGSGSVTGSDALQIINALAVAQVNGGEFELISFDSDDDRQSALDEVLADFAVSGLF